MFFGVGVSCCILYSFVGYTHESVSGSIKPRLGKRELICLLLFTCNYVVSVGEVSSFSGCLGWATLTYFIVALPEPSIIAKSISSK